MQALGKIDQSDPKSVQKYEDLMRKRLKKFGYHLSKRKTTLQTHNCIELRRGVKKRGFRITELDSGAIVSGEDYGLTIAEVEKFWLKEYERWYAEKRERRLQKYLKNLTAQKRPKTI